MAQNVFVFNLVSDITTHNFSDHDGLLLTTVLQPSTDVCKSSIDDYIGKHVHDGTPVALPLLAFNIDGHIAFLVGSRLTSLMEVVR